MPPRGLTLMHVLVLAGLPAGCASLTVPQVLAGGSGWALVGSAALTILLLVPILGRLTFWPLSVFSRCPACGRRVRRVATGPDPRGLCVETAPCGHRYVLSGHWESEAFVYDDALTAILLDGQDVEMGRIRANWPRLIVRFIRATLV